MIGLFLLAAFSVTVLSLRPGGLRRQLSFAARRFRVALALGGVYVAGSTAVRLLVRTDAVAEYAPPLLAALLMVAYVFLARDPGPAAQSPPSHRLP